MEDKKVNRNKICIFAKAKKKKHWHFMLEKSRIIPNFVFDSIKRQTR
jgi:hypothetical protein